MRTGVEYIEGPDAFKRFEDAMRKVLAVPHVVIQRKIAEHRAEADRNPKKRGPKRKAKPSSSHGPAV